jgi:hypothetical protein
MRTFTRESGLRKTRYGRGSHLVVLLDETPRHTHRTRDLVSDKEGLAASEGHQGPPVARLKAGEGLSGRRHSGESACVHLHRAGRVRLGYRDLDARQQGAGLTGEGHQLASLVHDRDARRDADLVRLS